MDELYSEEDLIEYQEYILGKEVDDFWRSPIGKYVIGRSLEESDNATKMLKDADPSDQERIRNIQSTIKIAEKSVLWLAEAIANGKRAQEQLEINEDIREEQP